VNSADSQSVPQGHGDAAPSPWVARFAPLVAPGAPVLARAGGGGRHARLFLDRGHPVLAVARDLTRLGDLAGHVRLEALACDLETGTLPGFLERRFGGIVVANYLHRPLLQPLATALAPSGVLIYETFARGNERFGKPRNPDFLLEAGELLQACLGRLKIVAYEDLVVEKPRPAAIQRICAQAPDVG